MAWAEQQRSGRYRGMYYDSTGKRRSVGTFTRKPEAERRAASEEDRLRGDPQAVDPRHGKLSWGEWCDQWQRGRSVEASTTKGDLSRIRTHIRPRWGDVPLNTIRREDVQAWVLELRDTGLSAEHVSGIYHTLSASMRAAVNDRRVSVSPCRDIALPPKPEGKERFLTHAEVSAVCRVLNEPYRTMVLLLVGSGLRWGEAAGLHWSRVDLAEGCIDVVESWSLAGRHVQPYPKSKRRRRVWIPEWLIAELEDHRARFPPAARCAARHRSDSRCPSGLVMPGRGGTVMNYVNFRSSHWCKAVGGVRWRLPDGREYESKSAARDRKGGDLAEPVWRDGLAEIGPATIHDLRHTFASWALQADPPMPILDLSRAMGHSSVVITDRRYSHLADTPRARFRAALAWPSEVDATQAPRAPAEVIAPVLGARERFGR